MNKGRIGWNSVTGHSKVTVHDERYGISLRK